MAAYENPSTEYQALTVELLHRSATLRYSSEQYGQVKRVERMLDDYFGPGATDRLADEITGRRMSAVEAVVWAATDWRQVATILGAAPEVAEVDLVPGTPEWAKANGVVLIDPRTPLAPEHLAQVAAEIAVIAEEEASGIADEQAIDMDEVVRILQEVHHVADAHVQHTGGGCMTIYAGVIGEVPDYGVRYAVCAGPGFYQQGAPSLAWTEEFCFGNDDEEMSDAVYVKDVCEDPADEAEVARHIAEFIAQKRGCECGMPGGTHSKGCPDPEMED